MSEMDIVRRAVIGFAVGVLVGVCCLAMIAKGLGHGPHDARSWVSAVAEVMLVFGIPCSLAVVLASYLLRGRRRGGN